MKRLSPVNIKQVLKLSNLEKQQFKLSCIYEVLWAVIGLLLTIISTFSEVFTINPPWDWSEQGFKLISLQVTYQIGAVLLTGCLGGKNAAAVAQTAYITIGLFWLPVFNQGGGIGYLKEPSFGYLLGFIPGGWLCGWITFWGYATIEWLGISAIAGLIVIHLVGIVYLTGLSVFSLVDPSLIGFGQLLAAINHYSLMAIPGHLIIVCVVTLIAFFVRRILFY